jgi:hypothetical protein
MDCKEAQKKFIPFIDDKLSVKELDAFLEHIEQCEECREEYDIYYTMIMGTRYLDDSTKSSDWVNPWEKLHFAQDYLFKYRILHWEKIAILVILCIGSVILFQ